jgi:hypothetical protein
MFASLAHLNQSRDPAVNQRRAQRDLVDMVSHIAAQGRSHQYLGIWADVPDRGATGDRRAGDHMAAGREGSCRGSALGRGWPGGRGISAADRAATLRLHALAHSATTDGLVGDPAKRQGDGDRFIGLMRHRLNPTHLSRFNIFARPGHFSAAAKQSNRRIPFEKVEAGSGRIPSGFGEAAVPVDQEMRIVSG